MRIKSVEIENYKSFLSKETIEFEPGFNLLLGANNAGKTSVLDVLDMDVNLNEPHRSERTIPQYGGPTNNASQVAVTISTTFDELWSLAGSRQLYLPLDSFESVQATADTRPQLEDLVYNNGMIEITSRISESNEIVSFVTSGNVGGKASRSNHNDSLPYAIVQYDPSISSLRIDTGVYSSVQPTLAGYAQLFKSRLYRFSASRRPGYVGGLTISNTLDREATSLPFCLNNLQTNDAHGHQILCKWVTRVFPSVKWVQSTSSPQGFELRCLPQLPDARRDDLAIPMARMGAGIGNVIAMFYVVMTSREPQVIAIDEPNAFLHPRALRELLAILEAEGKQHQFILTAHSADVLTAVNTRSVSLLNFDGIATTCRTTGSKDLHQLRGALAELGIRMSDLHAKDRVLWVEGQTEELVMPELLRWACPEIASGTSVLRVERTGTFDKAKIDPVEVAQIYERLSTSSAMVPPMMCILLDGETRSKEVQRKLMTSSGGKLRFLDRRMLENYLLHPKAIAATLLELEIQTTLIDIEKIVIDGLADRTHSDIDGAGVLSNIFSSLSDTRQEFRKTRDVPVLTNWILENDPEYLTPLRDCLRESFGL